MQREARALSGPRLGAASPADAAGTVLTRPPDAQRESRRIAGGLFGLGVLAVLLLNAGIYHSARNLLVNQRWEELVGETNGKRQAVRVRVHELEAHARFLTGQGYVVELAGKELDPGARRRLTRELENAVRAFGFHSIAAFSPEGRLLAGTALAQRDAYSTDAVHEAMRMQRDVEHVAQIVLAA